MEGMFEIDAKRQGNFAWDWKNENFTDISDFKVSSATMAAALNARAGLKRVAPPNETSEQQELTPFWLGRAAFLKKILYWCILPSDSERHPRLPTRAPPLSRGGRGRTGDQTIASPMPWPLGHDIPTSTSASDKSLQLIGHVGNHLSHCSVEDSDDDKPLFQNRNLFSLAIVSKTLTTTFTLAGIQ